MKIVDLFWEYMKLRKLKELKNKEAMKRASKAQEDNVIYHVALRAPDSFFNGLKAHRRGRFMSGDTVGGVYYYTDDDIAELATLMNRFNHNTISRLWCDKQEAIEQINGSRLLGYELMHESNRI